MPNSFQQSQDQGTQTDLDGQGTSFSKPEGDDNLNTVTEGDNVLSAEQLASLVKRDTNAQTHISTLETEAKDLRESMVKMQEQLDKAATLEDVLQGKDSTLDVDDLTNQVLAKVTEQNTAQQRKATADSNFNDVSTALTEKYGTDVDSTVKRVAEENDMTFDEMVELARKNPKLAKRLCDVEVKAPAQFSQASTNTSQYRGNGDDLNQQSKRVNVMELRTSGEQIADYNRRLDAKLKEMNK